MMKSYKNRVAVRVFSVHISVVFLALLIPLLRGCFKSKPKEITTFIEFGSPPAEQVNYSLDPTPTFSDPVPHPPPRDQIPDPPKKKDPPKRVKSKKDPPPKKPTKKHSNWKPVSADEIRKKIKNSKRIQPHTNKSNLSQREIEKMLGGIMNHSNRIGNSNSFAAYDATVQRIFYSAWQQPASEGRCPAKVRITIQGNGRIIARKLIQSSGNRLYDQSVMAAAQHVSVLPKPPKGYPDRFFIINFKLTH